MLESWNQDLVSPTFSRAVSKAASVFQFGGSVYQFLRLSGKWYDHKRAHLISIHTPIYNSHIVLCSFRCWNISTEVSRFLQRAWKFLPSETIIGVSSKTRTSNQRCKYEWLCRKERTWQIIDLPMKKYCYTFSNQKICIKECSAEEW